MFRKVDVIKIKTLRGNQNKNRSMEYTGHTDSCHKGGRRGDWMKEGEGISQRTCMYNS